MSPCPQTGSHAVTAANDARLCGGYVMTSNLPQLRVRYPQQTTTPPARGLLSPPVAVLLDAHGQLVSRHVDPLTDQTLTRFLSRLL